MKLSILASLVLLSACTTQRIAPESESGDFARPPRLSPDRPDNWSVYTKMIGGDSYVISRSLDEFRYMWLTCKVATSGVTGLSIGVVQEDAIGKQGDIATIIFMVDGREVIFGEGVMINGSAGALRSFDPREHKSLSDSEKKATTVTWIEDKNRIAQYEVINQMFVGDYVNAAISTNDVIAPDVYVDLQGFVEASRQVLDACGTDL